jgi:hypothetical protein
MDEKTLGEKRVKIDFNTTNDSLVDNIKRKSAELIDLCEKMRGDGSGEKQRVISLAQTGYEDACMWAVKANFTE